MVPDERNTREEAKQATATSQAVSTQLNFAREQLRYSGRIPNTRAN